MKKVLLFLFAFSVIPWIAMAQPNNWTPDGGAITTVKNTSNVYSGTASCEVTWTSTSNQYLTSDSIDVTEGSAISASFWVYDNDPAGRARLCIIYNAGTNYYGAFSNDGDLWESITYNGTVPAGATKAVLQIRFYDVSTDWDGDATVLVDNASLTLDGGSNLVLNADFEEWTDLNPPKWADGYPFAVGRDVNAVVYVHTDEPGTAYAIAVAAGSDAPTAEQVKAGADYGSVTVVSSGQVLIPSEKQAYSINLQGLSTETSYDIWVVAEDDEATPNLQTAPVKLPVTTIATRELNMTSPKPKDTAYIGDTIRFEWTAKNVDSLYLGAGMGGHFFIITDDDDRPIVVDATAGSYDLPIPYEANEGFYDVLLFDAADTSFTSNVADSVLLIDPRKVELLEPQPKDTAYVGDTVRLVWNAEFVDSVFFGGHDYTSDEDFIIEDDEGNPIIFDAAQGQALLPIPLDAATDSVMLVIYDAADPLSISDTVDPLYIMDTIPPQIDMTVPANDAQDIPYEFTAALYFTETVNILTGKIYLHAEDGTVLKEYDLTGSDISHDDEMISFPLDITLEPGKTYYFTMDADAVEDFKHNKFEGITGNDQWRFTAAMYQPYFSEYVEGGSSNKALEIYNPTDHAIDLSRYAILSSYNGKGWQYPPYLLSGTLQPGDVYTIVNPDFDFSLLADSAAVVDTLIGPYLTWFNGDDARAIVQLLGGSWDDNPNFTIIDIIGDPDNDPGNGWPVAGISEATKDHTLIRKRTVVRGNVVAGWEASAGTDAQTSEWMVMDKDFVGNLGYPTPDASDNTTITEVVLYDTTGVRVSTTTSIDSANATVSVEVLYSAGHMVDSLVPVITVADNGMAEISGDTVDFTNPVTFTVTAEDGLTTRTWTITVTVAAAPSGEAEITSLSIEGQSGETVIDATAHTVTVPMPYGTDMTALTPVFEVSVGATADPPSGTVLDLSDTLDITVTAEDGTSVVWKLIATAPVPAEVGIYDVQFTTDASGDSPYIDQLVRVSGIVTAVNIYKNDFKGYFLQDSAAAWNGIYVFDPGRDSVKVGDSLTVVGTVTEYYSLTEVKNILDLQIHSHENALPGPVEITTGQASDEKWESVFVVIHNASCIDNNLGYGEVSFDDGTGEIRVDDFLYPYDAANDFVVGNVYHVQGIIYFSYGNYKLLPRSAEDISDVTGIGDMQTTGRISVYPNPSDGRFYVTIDQPFSRTVRITLFNTLGKVMTTREVPAGGQVSEAFDVNVPAGFYFLRVEDGDNTVVRRIIIR